MKKDLKLIPVEKVDRIIEMAWEDRTPFDAILSQFGLKEQDVIKLMRNELKPKSFRLWRERVQGRKTKHVKIRESEIDRFKCSRQRSISNNKVSKR
jgi:uncharacterized protein (TIGR03643 family)|tara:strand:+ start:4208 stop:4495 length:288 start_codon:yes stop_codon:yes gene_type:complete